MKKLKIVLMSLAVAAMALTIQSCKTKLKDSDIQATIEKAISADGKLAGTAVAVKDGIATLTGQLADNSAVTYVVDAIGKLKGVKSVVNNLTVAPPPAPVVNADDAALTQGLADIFKDVPSVTSSIKDGKIVLVGEIVKAKWAMIKQTLDKLKSKGYDLTGLKIK